MRRTGPLPARDYERRAGLVGLSGYLPLAAHTDAERSAAHSQVPVFMPSSWVRRQGRAM